MSVEPDKVLREVMESIVGAANPRPGLSDVINLVCSGSNVILSAPAGYGKTIIPYTLGLLCKRGMSYSVSTYHILPLRSIIDDVWSRLFRNSKPKHKELDNLSVGRQMMGVSEAPNLQKPFVITTMDTFLMALLKIPPADLTYIWKGVSLGHGEYTRALILYSVTIFDEIQLMMEESGIHSEVFLEVVKWLTHMGSKVVLMTATLPRQLEHLLTQNLCNVRFIRYGVDFKDPEFEALRLSNTIITEKPLYTSISEAAREFVKGGQHDRVALIVNTVKSLVEVSEAVKEYVEPVILHSGLKLSDRRSRIERVRSSKEYILVSTQVIEAGVDLSFQAMLTEATTPCSMVQRVGRLLRHDEGEEGILRIVYDPLFFDKENSRYTVYPAGLVESSIRIIQEILARGQEILWHLPIQDGYMGFEKYMERSYLESGYQFYRGRTWESDIVGQTLSNIIHSPNRILDLLMGSRGILRDGNLVLGVVESENAESLPEDDLVPLNMARLRLIYEWCKKKGGVKGLYIDKSGESLKINDASEDVRNILGGRAPSFYLRAIIVPEDLYDETYGITGVIHP